MDKKKRLSYEQNWNCDSTVYVNRNEHGQKKQSDGINYHLIILQFHAKVQRVIICANMEMHGYIHEKTINPVHKKEKARLVLREVRKQLDDFASEWMTAWRPRDEPFEKKEKSWLNCD